MTKRHWGQHTFIQTGARQGGGFKEGYCATCYADMQWFATASQGIRQGFAHYNSHTRAKQLGLNWKARAA